jgi:hypothetical protein
MTQYIGQITVILEAASSKLASETLCTLARQIDDTCPDVIFADHNGDVEDYEAIEHGCQEAHAPLLPVLLSLLEAILPYAESEACTLEKLNSPEAEADAEKAWKTIKAAQTAIALATGNASPAMKAACDPEADASRVHCAASSPTNAGLPEIFASEPVLIQKQLTSSRMVHTPGIFRALRNDYRIKGEPRRRAIKILSDVYGIPPAEAKGLLSGAIAIVIDAAAGTITYAVPAGE